MDESDEPEASSNTLRDLLADLNISPTSSVSHARLASAQAQSWTFSPPPRSSPSYHHVSRHPTLLPQRTSSRENAHSVPEADSTNRSPSQTPPLFSTPNRSIFSSGPPTSSISINTAQASMSTPPPSNSTRPLSALTAPGISQVRRSVVGQSESSLPSRKTRFSTVEKDVDDPSASTEDPLVRMGETSTPTALASLFTAPDSHSPAVSRNGSFMHTAGGVQYTRATGADTTPLPAHLYNRGLLSGRHSDITVHAFNTRYPLHRLLLDRAPFFCSALSEPWFESSAKEITLHPEDSDPNITQAAFELALKRIYGCHKIEEEDKEAMGLFATGCWLDMADLIAASINSLLRQMSPANLASYIRLVTSNYYGKHGDKVLAGAKAMLCREGYEMSSRYFDGISGDIIREIIGSDGFYVPGEWERWALAKRILNRRLKTKAIEAGLTNPDGKLRHPRPHSMNFMAIRFDTVYRSTSSIGGTDASPGFDQWLGLYTNPDISPILVLLDEGIHYLHLSFEQLQVIREQRDILGVPLMPEKVISNALWMSMELRQRILNAKESDEELGFSFEVEPQDEEGSATPVEDESDNPTSSSKDGESEIVTGKRPVLEQTESEETIEMESGSWDGNGKPRKFWIPVRDGSHLLGCTLEPTVSAFVSRPHSRGRHTSRVSASLDPQDLQWATDFASTVQERPDSPCTSTNAPSPEVRYTHFPPFRFAAEFPPVRSLKENRRVYSNTVWYAGSLWNVYVQRKETAKHTQLGIWLHRAPHVEGSETLIANIVNSSVDERIGHLERELLIRRHGHRRVHTDARNYASDDTSSGNDSTLVGAGSQDLDTLSGLFHTQAANNITKASEGSPALSGSAQRREGADTADDTELSLKRYKVPTMPPYVDHRPKIKTYFKIYTPSRGGRVLSVNESAPDSFDLARSFGWKSSLDEWISGGGEDGGRAKDQRLRLMVVIGNI